MGLIWKESDNKFLLKYKKIRHYFKMYKNGELDIGDYEALKAQQLENDNFESSIFQLSDKEYNGIMLEALIDIYELFNCGAITKTEYDAELNKVRLRKPVIKLPPDFFN